MEWLTNPWVIGIGTAVIAGVVVGLILYYGFGIGKAKPRNQMSNSLPAIEEKPGKQMSSIIPVIEEKQISNLLPREIIEHLDSLPPLQRESVANNYKGIKVSWKVNLEAGHALAGGKLCLMMLNEGHYPWISCDADPNLYPEIKVVKKNLVFRIEGEIKSIKGNLIGLGNCRLYF